MSIVIRCPNPACGEVLKVKNRYAGKNCYCPVCRTLMAVAGRPSAATRMPRPRQGKSIR